SSSVNAVSMTALRKGKGSACRESGREAGVNEWPSNRVGQAPGAFAAAGGAVALQLGGQRLEVDADLPEARQHLLGVTAVVRKRSVELAVLGEGEQRLLRQ